MGEIAQVSVPDIGDFTDVPIIEIQVKPGDRVKAEEPLITLESDKASMEVPSPAAGIVKTVAVKLGDKVSEGTPILTLEVDGARAKTEPVKPAVSAPPAPTSAPAGVAEVRVPDIGDFKDVPIIEVMVKPGDTIKPEQPLVTLESDKASMEVPSPLGGVVSELKVRLGDRANEGTVILTLVTDAASAAQAAASAMAPARVAATTPAAATPAMVVPSPAPAAPSGADAAFDIPYAGPSVRKLAREGGIDLRALKGSGPRGRILPADIVPAPAAPPSAPAVAAAAGLDLLPWPKVDFAKFGPIESKPLSRIKKISGANLHRNWVMIPHVTNHDEADITELEDFRVRLNKEIEKSGVRVSMLAFMIKAAVASLKKFPEFNSSLDGDNLIVKKYFHIGFAAETPQGLVRTRRSRRRQEERNRDREGDGRSGKACPRRQAQAGSHAGRHVHDLQPRRDRRDLFHADHQRARSRNHGRLPVVSQNGLGQQAGGAAPHPAVIALLGSPRDRRCGGCALQRIFCKPSRRHAPRPRIGE